MLGNLGEVATDEGRYDEARVHLTECIARSRALGDWRLPHQLTDLAIVAHNQGKDEDARSLLNEALAGFRQRGDRDGSAYALVNLAEIAHDCGNHADAQSALREVLAIEREVGNPEVYAMALGVIGDVAFALDRPVAAARLWGQAERLHAPLSAPAMSAQGARRERDITAARATLGEDAFMLAWNDGRAMTLDEAVDFALDSMNSASNA